MQFRMIPIIVAVSVVVSVGCASSERARRDEDPAGYMQRQQARTGEPTAAASPTSSVAVNDGLCPLRMSQRANAEIDTEVDQEEQSVIVEATTDDEAAVQGLRDQASELAAAGHYRLDQEAREESVDESTGVGAAPESVRIHVTSQDIEDGARLTFVPADASNMASLYAQLQEDANEVESGDCTAPAAY